jgi:hypothetical protein
MRRDAEMSGGGGTARRRQTLEAELVCLEAHGASGLHEAWAKAHGGPAPTALPARLLRLALAHYLQVRALGGLTPALEKRLARIAAGTGPRDDAIPASTRRLSTATSGIGFRSGSMGNGSCGATQPMLPSPVRWPGCCSIRPASR